MSWCYKNTASRTKSLTLQFCMRPFSQANGWTPTLWCSLTSPLTQGLSGLIRLHPEPLLVSISLCAKCQRAGLTAWEYQGLGGEGSRGGRFAPLPQCPHPAATIFAASERDLHCSHRPKVCCNCSSQTWVTLLKRGSRQGRWGVAIGSRQHL